MQYINSVTYNNSDSISYRRRVLGSKTVITVKMSDAHKSLMQDIEISTDGSKLHSKALLK